MIGNNRTARGFANTQGFDAVAALRFTVLDPQLFSADGKGDRLIAFEEIVVVVGIYRFYENIYCIGVAVGRTPGNIFVTPDTQTGSAGATSPHSAQLGRNNAHGVPEAR